MEKKVIRSGHGLPSGPPFIGRNEIYLDEDTGIFWKDEGGEPVPLMAGNRQCLFRITHEWYWNDIPGSNVIYEPSFSVNTIGEMEVTVNLPPAPFYTPVEILATFEFESKPYQRVVPIPLSKQFDLSSYIVSTFDTTWNSSTGTTKVLYKWEIRRYTDNAYVNYEGALFGGFVLV